jgi:tripartite-type tricarboxylate transporter receptor subunit TctC
MWPLITMVDHVKSGKLRALAISNGKERSPLVPNVPRFAEVGLAELRLERLGRSRRAGRHA